jgi:hypothetical protein
MQKRTKEAKKRLKPGALSPKSATVITEDSFQVIVLMILLKLGIMMMARYGVISTDNL